MRMEQAFMRVHNDSLMLRIPKMMKFFYWNKNFEIGIAAIDRQHQRLVNMINDLAASMTQGAHLTDVQALFCDLMEYATEHFHDEEQLLRACTLPQDEKIKHVEAHRGFEKKIQGFIRRSDLLQAQVAEEVLGFLTTWLISHILGSDREIARTLRHEGEAPQINELLESTSVERVLLGSLTGKERRYRHITNHTPSLIWVSDAAGERGFFNHAWTDYLGLDAESAHSIAWQEFIHPDDLPSYLDVIAQCLVGREPAEFEYRLQKRNGHYCWFLEKIVPRTDAAGVFMGMIAAATDISEIKQAELLLVQTGNELEQQLEQRAVMLEQILFTDALTGFGNRRLLMRCLDDEISRARRYMRSLSMVFFDIDDFARINDTYGHAVGDLVLTMMADALKSCLRECDQLARYGGEEFVVLLPETGMQEAVAVAERLRAAVTGIRLAQMPVTLTVSAGLVEWSADESRESLLQRCDRALTRAKTSGRNQCCVDAAA